MRLIRAEGRQQLERDHVTYSAWGMKLSLPQYVQREARLRAHPWARETLQTWFLVDEGGGVLSSCETFRMEARWRGEGVERPVTVYAVASVFTEERLRGRRYAPQMLERLHRQVVQEDPSVKALVLYSDVGEALYARVGYASPRAAFDWVFSPEPGSTAGGGAQSLPELLPQPLHDADVASALERIPRPEVPFLIWPTAAQVDWHLERERLYAEFLGRARPAAVGARVGHSTALWAVTGRGKLEILVMHAESPHEASALIRAARQAAAQGGAETVHLWEPSPAVAWPFSENGGVRVPREGSLPMLCPLDPALRPELWQGPLRAIWV